MSSHRKLITVALVLLVIPVFGQTGPCPRPNGGRGGWQALGTPNGTVEVLVVYRGDLIAGGFFIPPGDPTFSSISSWDGSQWEPLPLPIAMRIETGVRALFVHNGELIIGGSFPSAGTINARNIARWNGSTMQPLGEGVDFGVHTMTAYNGELIAGGFSQNQTGTNAYHIARWNGSSWNSLEPELATETDVWENTEIRALAVFNGELIIAGDFATAGGVNANNIIRWNGSQWKSLGDGVGVGGSGTLFHKNVNALAVYKNELIVGGSFFAATAGGVEANLIARWNGSQWRSLEPGIDKLPLHNESIDALAVFNDELIAAGEFLTAGGRDVYNIARWDGRAWHPLGGGLMTVSPVESLIVDGNKLVAGGGIYFAGEVFVDSVATWTSPQ